MDHETASLQQIEQVIARRERFSLAISAAISAAIVGGAVLFLAYSAYLLHNSHANLARVQSELAQRQAELARTAEANAEAKSLEAKLQSEIAAARLDAERANAEKARLQTEIASARSDVERANSEVNRLRASVDDANRQLAALSAQIRSSTDYAQHLHPVGWEDAKYLYGSSNRLAELLEKILQLKERRIPFNLANTVEQGFTSPGFAAYILGQIGLARQGSTLQSAIEGFPRADKPRLGDLVLYRGGFAMFYLEDHERHPFVIGMTPAGIAALQPEFGVPTEDVRRTGIMR
ncbi:hypothetical protein [Bradyrhizobium sp.]